jgi:hypothetical protein
MAIGLAALPADVRIELRLPFPQVVVRTTGMQSILFANKSKRCNSRNSALPQRMQVFRGFASEIDITIPHEHSRTGMPHAPVLSAQLS